MRSATSNFNCIPHSEVSARPLDLVEPQLIAGGKVKDIRQGAERVQADIFRVNFFVVRMLPKPIS